MTTITLTSGLKFKGDLKGESNDGLIIRVYGDWSDRYIPKIHIFNIDYFDEKI
jgi:hypothetical protein